MKEERVRIHRRSDDRVRGRRQYARARNCLRSACSKLYLVINYRNELLPRYLIVESFQRRLIINARPHTLKHLFLSVLVLVVIFQK